MANGLVGDVIERHNKSAPSRPPRDRLGESGCPSKTGFPAVQHRSKTSSAFKRARQDERVQSGLSESREQLTGVSHPRSLSEDSRMAPRAPQQAEDWMAEISRTNEAMVAKMGADEIAHERQDIVDKFGHGIDDLITKVREARERRMARPITSDTQGTSHALANSTGTPHPESETPSPRTRTVRKIRFAEPTEADVHVYESQPSSPKRALGLLPSPINTQDRADISFLGNFKSTPKEDHPSVELNNSSRDHIDNNPPDEGTPEDIRRRFFPNEMPPETNPTLTWMLPSSATSTDSSIPADRSTLSQQGSNTDSTTEPRYSLSGTQLSPTEIASLPTHLGLHHHASSSASSDVPAGYTLSDFLLLSRSSVPAQRSSILGVLVKVLRNTRVQKMQYLFSRSGIQGPSQVAVESSDDIDLNTMRRDALDVAIGALGEKGGVGQRGVELLWEATVGFIQYDYGVVDLKDLAYVDFTPYKSPTRKYTHSDSTPSSNSPTNSANIEHASPDVIASLPVAMILPMLRQHLTALPPTVSRTHTQVLEILLVLSHFAAHACAIVHPDSGYGVLAAILEPHLRSTFDSMKDTSDYLNATPTSIHILQALARSSRDNAIKLVGPADVLLRYVAEMRPPVTSALPHDSAYSSFRHFMSLLEETLRFYDVLSQYGLYSQIATTAQEHFTRIGTWILDAMHTFVDPAFVSLSRAYVHLLGSLIVCATDPHQTSPSHDILWSQVQGWGWAEWIIQFANVLTSASESVLAYALEDVSLGLWANIFHTMAAWMEGISVNGVKNGEVEMNAALGRLKPFFETGRRSWNALTNAMATLRVWETCGVRDLVQAAELVHSIIRLSVASFRSNASDTPFDFLDNEIQDLCINFANNVSPQGPFPLILSCERSPIKSESAHVTIRPLSSLLVCQLRHWRQSMSRLVDSEGDRPARDVKWITQALRVFRALLPGDEDHAQWIVRSVLETIDSDLVRQTIPTMEVPQGMWEKDGLNILFPFLSQSIRGSIPSVGEDVDRHNSTYIAPTWPTPKSISRCTTLNIPCMTYLQQAWDAHDPDIVLSLKTDWLMSPLNHLLRSGASSVFHALPPTWNASETDIVRASLLLALVVQAIGGNGVDSSLCMSSGEAIFACMKVFMLEHGQQQVDTGEEVFRDRFVTHWMEDLLKPFIYSHCREEPSNEKKDRSFESLEQVSRAFLGAGTPFFQFYTDFLALYDAISFSHPLFARLLLPPVSMSYQIDYRKLLFGDFGHVLRTLRTDVPLVLCGDVRDYLWPVERDVNVIGLYLKSLVTSQLYGIVRWIAVHHVAANIWPEFTSEYPMGRERAGKLLSTVLQQCNNEIIKEVALYRQQRDEVWTPPDCFVLGEITWRITRLEWVRDVGGERAKARLQNLYLD